MAEVDNTPKPEVKVDATSTSDQSLSSAWDESQGKNTEDVATSGTIIPTPNGPAKIEEEPAPPKPQKTTEEEDNAERSRLGRRVKKMEETMTEILQELRNRPAPSQDSEKLPDIISTPDDVERVISERERKKEETKRQFLGQYAKTVEDLGEDDPELHKEVLETIFANPKQFDMVDFIDPVSEATKNYSRAMKATLAKKYASKANNAPKPNVKGETPISPTGVTVGQRMPEPQGESVQLDEFASEFVKKVGLKDDWAKAALKDNRTIMTKR